MIDQAPHPEEDAPFQNRLRQMIAIFLVAICLVVARVLYLNLVCGEELYEYSSQNYHKTEAIEAPRGSIVDREGTPLATNRLTFDVLAHPYNLSEEELKHSLAELSRQTGKNLLGALDMLLSERKRRKDIVLLRGLDFERAAPVFERIAGLPGLFVQPVYRRYYPDGPLAAHVLGHVGAITGLELKGREGSGYGLRDRIGKSYLEVLYEEALRGAKGKEFVRRDARGRVREVINREPAKPGLDVRLTVDRRLQIKANELIAGRPGCLIAMEPNTGEVLVMVSSPAYDPNQPGAPLAPDQPASEVNRATQGTYMPGSAFKLVTAYAALKQGIDPTRQVNCSGSFYLDGWDTPYLCDNRWGHGNVDMTAAIQMSCNIYFYTMARAVGPRNLMEAAREWGFGSPTGIDLGRAEGKGFLPEPRKLYAGDVLHIGIGQGKIIVTPLQVLRAYAALANGGRLARPHVVSQVGARRVEGLAPDDEPSTQTVDLSPVWREIIVEALWRAVNMEGGTAYRARFPAEWKVAGKTSSVQNVGAEETNSWFVCFAPKNAPVIAVLAMIENAGHGGDVAAPLVRDFLQEYFDLYPLESAPRASRADAG